MMIGEELNFIEEGVGAGVVADKGGVAGEILLLGLEGFPVGGGGRLTVSHEEF